MRLYSSSCCSFKICWALKISGFVLCKTTFTPVTVLIVLRNVLSCVSVVVLTVRSPWWSSIIKRTASSVEVRRCGCFHPTGKNINAEIQVSRSPAAGPTQSRAWFHLGTEWVCSLAPVKEKVVGYHQSHSWFCGGTGVSTARKQQRPPAAKAKKKDSGFC